MALVNSSSLETLLLCDYRRNVAATVCDHIDALRQHTGQVVKMLSCLGNFPENLDLNRFDVVIVHYSLILSSDSYLTEFARSKLRDFAGLKVVFVQDECRWVNRTVEALNFIGTDLLYSCVPPAEMDKVYAPDATAAIKKRPTLTGYVPRRFLLEPVLDFEDRPIEVGYRGRKLSAYFGRDARQKWRIAEEFAQHSQAYGLRCDLSYRESDRLYGSDWINFLRHCRAVLGVESGGEVVIDFSGELLERIEDFEKRNPSTSFEKIQQLFLDDREMVNMRQISPRCFEAAALRCLMILQEGEYSGLLEPWRHYLPLKKDYSNLAEVVEILRDPERWARVVENAYREIACNPALSYEHFGAEVGRDIQQAFSQKAVARCRPYSSLEFLGVQLAWACRTRLKPVLSRVRQRLAAKVSNMEDRFRFWWQVKVHWVRTRPQRVHNGIYVLLNRMPRRLYLALRGVYRRFKPRPKRVANSADTASPRVA
jgi:hypothetical protein